jgi:hypothetical protein
MGDHRFDVKISVCGVDGKEHKLDWWINWHSNNPEKLYAAVVELAREAGLPVDERHLIEESDLM